MLLCGTASAIPIVLVLTNPSAPFQQTQSSPCVIGGPSCNNPVGFGFTNINAAENDGTVTLAESLTAPPGYLVSQITGIVGSTFNIGIDTNQAGNSSDTNNWLKLQEFDVLVNGVIQFQYIVAAPGTQISLNNGNGYSDASLSLVNLSTFLPGDRVKFQTWYNNATDGSESFFLYSAAAQPCTVNCPSGQVPEPGTLLLLGSALAALGGFARRKARAGVQT